MPLSIMLVEQLAAIAEILILVPLCLQRAYSRGLRFIVLSGFRSSRQQTDEQTNRFIRHKASRNNWLQPPLESTLLKVQYLSFSVICF
eukprot:2031116-Amphidinium_carterae.1